MKIGNLQQAIGFFTESIDKNQEVGESYFVRGLCYNLLKDYNNSINDFVHSENLGNRNDDRLYTLRGFAYSQKGESELALKDLEKAILINKDYIRNYFNRGMLKVRLNKNNEAIDDLNYYLSKSEDPNAYFERGKIHLLLSNKIAACRDFEKAVLLKNNNETLINLKNSNCH